MVILAVVVIALVGLVVAAQLGLFNTPERNRLGVELRRDKHADYLSSASVCKGTFAVARSSTFARMLSALGIAREEPAEDAAFEAKLSVSTYNPSALQAIRGSSELREFFVDTFKALPKLRELQFSDKHLKGRFAKMSTDELEGARVYLHQYSGWLSEHLQRVRPDSDAERRARTQNGWIAALPVVVFLAVGLPSLFWSVPPTLGYASFVDVMLASLLLAVLSAAGVLALTSHAATRRAGLALSAAMFLFGGFVLLQNVPATVNHWSHQSVETVKLANASLHSRSARKQPTRYYVTEGSSAGREYQLSSAQYHDLLQHGATGQPVEVVIDEGLLGLRFVERVRTLP